MWEQDGVWGVAAGYKQPLKFKPEDLILQS